MSDSTNKSAPDSEPGVVQLERIFNAGVKQVWQAITDKDQMKQWYFDLPEFRAEVGFEFRFPGKGSEGADYMHHCKVLEAEPFRKLSYSWKYEGQGGNSTVSFELFEEGDKTKLVLTHVGLDTFPSENPDFDRSSFNDGWNMLVGKLLGEFLEK